MTARNKLSNKAQYWGGKARETVGRVTGNRRTEYEGKRDQMKANLKDAGENVKDAFRRVTGFQDHPRRVASPGNQRPVNKRGRRSL
jgi:uncharacterized protein YjbJ (UPF0337 family)